MKKRFYPIAYQHIPVAFLLVTFVFCHLFPGFRSFAICNEANVIPSSKHRGTEVLWQMFPHATLFEVAYGSTETSPVVNLMYPDDPFGKRSATVGTTLSNTENKIVDAEGHVVPIGTSGELLSRGYCVMLKYWGDEKKTEQAIDKSGWYHSGDLATMDEDGFIKVVGRIKDVIIRGGENVYPTEVEDFLHTHPKVDDVQVIGLPDKRMGEEVGAWIRLKEGEEATHEELKDYCKGEISHFKIPKYIKFVNEFPITVTRKVQKYKMREEFAKELGLTA